MPDVFAQVLARPDLHWILAACLIGGIVRGFSGFGTALIVLPVAARLMDPVAAIVMVVVMDAFGPLPLMAQAVRDSRLADIRRLVMGMIVTLPVGLSLLLIMQADIFRYAVSVIALLLLFCLICGFRYRGELRSSFLYGVGALSGFTGGFAGVPGPPVILIYMASTASVRVVRANATIFLYCFDLLILFSFWLSGRLDGAAVALGIAAAFPVVLGNLVGNAIFSRGHERVYRAVAYVLIATAAISGLPLWDV